jgi:hypothetical protein
VILAGHSDSRDRDTSNRSTWARHLLLANLHVATAAEDREHHAPVLGATFLGIVVCDRLLLAKAFRA